MTSNHLLKYSSYIGLDVETTVTMGRNSVKSGGSSVKFWRRVVPSSSGTRSMPNKYPASRVNDV